MFDISYFRENPLPFYTLAHELHPGKYRPTISHSFLKLLADKGLLLKVFTQNIDCLERKAGVPQDKIIEAHGSFASQRCIECKTAYPDDLMKENVETRDVPYCLTQSCNGLVKPDIVFFGEPLPEEFHLNKTLPVGADLCIVMGTSLSVHPFAGLPGFCSSGVPRVLINLERVGDLGTRPDDVLLLQECDEGVRKLATALGWIDELEAYWNETKPDGDNANPSEEAENPESNDEVLEKQIGILTTEVEKSLKITADHDAWLRDFLRKEQEKQQDSAVHTEQAKPASTLSNPHEGVLEKDQEDQAVEGDGECSPEIKEGS